MPLNDHTSATFGDSGDYTDQDKFAKTCYLMCQLCPVKHSRIYVTDKDYDCKHYENMATWFTTMKRSIGSHIQSHVHQQHKEKFDKHIEENDDVLENIKKSLRYLVYYVIRSNIAFISFPPLLATAYGCGIEIGDINHTNDFVSRILPLINTVLMENTKEWLGEQRHISISLDIGTEMGLVLLVVYYIGEDGRTRLAGCELTDKKDGHHCATLCYNIAHSNIYVEESIIQQKTNAIIADGAFVDGNTPFKNQIRLLFRNPNMIFRWDILHMFNRAHISARGLTSVDLSALSDAERQAAQRRNRPPVSDMMNYVQHESKTWRSGVRYTQLTIETLDFMRPKIYSSTRMSLYEFDQIKRFIEVSHYLDVPWEYEIMSRLYCLIMFVEKIILKNSQKTSDIRDYVARVFLGVNGNDPEGKTAMKLALRVGKDVIRSQTINYLNNGNYVDVISSNPGQNVFIQEMQKFITDMQGKLVPSSTVPTGRTRRQANLSLTQIETSLDDFIEKLWTEFELRTTRTDLTSRDCWCFSEAPCEAFFSKWGAIISTRPSLTVDNVIRLIRIQLEGPCAGTDEAHKLMRTAMGHYLTISHLGERYCTQRWVPGRISSTVTNAINKPWLYAAYS